MPFLHAFPTAKPSPATRLSTLFALTALAGAVPAQAAQSEKPPSPKPWLEEKVEQARQLSLREVERGSKEEEALKTELKTLIDDMLDWSTMTRRSLGRSWKKLDGKQQTEFSTLLRKLMEASYQSKMRMASRGKVDRPKKVTIDWGEAKIRRNTARIEAEVKVDKGKTFLGFKLRWNGKRWRVFDVIIDDVSTVRTYRSQFRKLIEDKGFDELMRRMRAKLEDIEAGRAELPSTDDR